MSLEDRFFQKVRKTASCWNWIATKNTKGYGRIWVGNRNEFAHRVAFSMKYGAIPSDLRVLHRCDNPSCVNPEHLFSGTDADNGADKAIKGRAPKGEKNGNNKLSADDVLTIRNSTDSLTKLGRVFGVHRKQIANIKARKQWGHV